MENAILIIISALLSGILATLITIWWQRKNQNKMTKLKIFTTLMSKRYEISAEESVEALNMIDVIFYKSDKVRNAWNKFNEATNLPDTSTRSQAIQDKHLRLLEVIADDIGYKNIHWDSIKQYYYPIALSEKKQDEAMLRRINIDAGIAQINKFKQNVDVSQTNKNDEFSQQVLLEALKNPNNLLQVMELAEKAKKNNKVSE